MVKGRCCSLAGKVNRTCTWWKVLATYHQIYDIVTCRLTAAGPPIDSIYYFDDCLEDYREDYY